MGTKRRLLITGGSGFLGRHLAIRLRADHEVVLGARSESRGIEAGRVTGCAVVPLDVARLESVRDAFARAAPDVVIHAAAVKHVGVAEDHPHECIDVNVVGSQNVARVAREGGVSAVVGISTDKAAPPAPTVYGASKALMERAFCALDDPGSTRFTAVRLGNIAWSTASVLPEWRDMLRSDGVVGSTGPDARRFLMSVDDAVDVVDSAMRNIEQTAGRVLVRPLRAARVRDLLQAFLSVHGGRWERLAPRPYDAGDESLLAAEELRSARQVEIDGKPHVVIGSPNGAHTDAPSAPICSSTAERLTESEIERLVTLPGSI